MPVVLEEINHDVSYGLSPPVQKCRPFKINDVDQASFGDLGLFGAEFLEKLLTEILQLGITMPSMQGVQLKSPR